MKIPRWMHRRLLPIILEIFGVSVVSIGIGVELATHAEIGWVLVTSGSCLTAIGGIIWGKLIPKR